MLSVISHSLKIDKRKEAVTIDYVKANPMAEIKGLVMHRIPDHAQTVTLRVGQHLSPNFEFLKKLYYVTICIVYVHIVTYNYIYSEAKGRRETKG